MNQFTYQQPFEGNSCAGIFTYDGSSGQEWREWLIVPLLDTLVLGQTYYCSFRANAAFGGTSLTLNQLASDHLGMLFTTYDRQWQWGDAYPPPINHAHILYPQILSDTVNWTLVSGSFVADSAYTYLMIGNFFSNALTDTIHFASDVPGWAQYSYVLIDGVCVSFSPDGCESNLGVLDLDGAEPIVYPNPASDVLVIGNAVGRDAILLNMLGQQVWSGRVNTERYAVDVGSWARGAYVLQVRDAQSVQVLKFVLVE
ncbi:MAG: T9SS type A sorting domain-containing protein [Bacteroidetes bacterium]|nr:T9SS type A sorting domain-containing protein [Bacteroidota bacterium]MBS1941462.1 T9SS type A sorting domain-containing protein [Bacteroidota bacterium]